MTADIPQASVNGLADVAPGLATLLTRADGSVETPAVFAEPDITQRTVMVPMRDGIRLATDLYLPPTLPAPVAVRRTPYGRRTEQTRALSLAFARRGYVAIAQDVRGTGDSEPDFWDYYVYEPQDGFDLVEWVTSQPWFDGHLFAHGASYSSSTQWPMAAHPRMTAIVPEMGGLQVGRWVAGRGHMFVNGYARSVGKVRQRLPVSHKEAERLLERETMEGGYFNEPLHAVLPPAVLERYPDLTTLPDVERKRQLWLRLCELGPAEAAGLLREIFDVETFSYGELVAGPTVFDGISLPGILTFPSADAAALCQRFHAPALMVTGWYDWNMFDVLPSWMALRRHADADVRERSRLIITPFAHNAPGYREGAGDHPELLQAPRTDLDLLLRWYDAVRDGTTDEWPRVSYYLMGANEWRVASDWPVPEAAVSALYLRADGSLSADAPRGAEPPDRYTYDPHDPTPTVGGSIVSYLYPPGGVDVSDVQERADVLTYTTEPLDRDLDVVGPLRLVLYAGSSARDTDFVARISDVFPDGRVIQLQNGMLRARFRSPEGPALLEPGRVYRFEIDMWSTANRFRAGHRLRVDISSADFPRFDRNANRGGEPGEPVPAIQTIHHDSERPSHLVLSLIAP